MLINIVETLEGTIDAKDKYAKGHSSCVADYAREIAKRAGYKKHPVIGAKILQNMKEKTGMDIGARSHHERYLR